MESAEIPVARGGPAKVIPLVEPWLGQECADAVRAQVASGFIGPGEACRALSKALALETGSPYCVLTTSGTVALSVAAVALGLRPGDEILVPAYGVVSTINAFAALGLRPRLVDVDARSGCITAATLEPRITPATKAVCFVNFCGATGDELAGVAALCAERNLPLIEDAAQAIGQRHRRRHAGSFGTIGTLSFSVPKTLTTGQGGALLTPSPELAAAALKYVDHGDLEWRRTNLNREIGTNLRFNDVLAALGLAQLRTLEQRLARKRAAYGAMRDVLGDRLHAIPGEEAPFYYIVFSEDPESTVAALRSRAIMAQRHGRALYEHPPYAHLHDAEFPGARHWNERAVYLPFGLALSPADARTIAEAALASAIGLAPN